MFVRKSRESFTRSIKRAYYLPEPVIEQEAPAKEPSIWVGIALRILYMLISLLMLLVMYPVGLILLWMKWFRAHFSIKLALSVVGCAAFLWLVSIFINAPFESPRLLAVQGSMREALSYYGHDSGKVVEAYSLRLDTFPENVSNVTFRMIRSIQTGLHRHLALMNARITSLGAEAKDILYILLLRSAQAVRSIPRSSRATGTGDGA